MKLDTGHWLTILGIVFAVGGSWATTNAKIEALDKKLGELAAKQAEPLCLAVITTQLKAVEKDNPKAKDELARLNRQFCPQPVNDALNASHATVEETKEQQLKEVQQANDKLKDILTELSRQESKDGEQRDPSALNQLPPDLFNGVERVR